jgi:putative transposase
VQSWQHNWVRIVPFFDYPAEICKVIYTVIYTTDEMESINISLRKVTESRGPFPDDEALIKLYYLSLRNFSKKLTMPIQNWKATLNSSSSCSMSACSKH